MKNKRFNLILLSFIFLCGCSAVGERAKQFWGSSTQALENARKDALQKSFSCSWEQCFTAVVEYANGDTQQLIEPKSSRSDTRQADNSTEQKTIRAKNLDLFKIDRRLKLIVIMGVPGSVNTTEVALFFVPISDNKTQVEVTSLSTSAKIRAADIIFAELEKQFK